MAIPLLRVLTAGAVVGTTLALIVADTLSGRAAAAARQSKEPASRPELPLAPQTAAPEKGERRLSVTITPAMVRLSNTRYALYFLGTLWSAGALLFVLRSGISARLRDLAERKSGNRLVQAYIFYPALSLVLGSLSLPLTFYSSFVLPHQYGLSNQAFTGWVADGLKSFLISAAVAPPVIALLFATLRRNPKWWWMIFWIAAIPLLVLSVLLTPLVVEPLFNRVEPLRNQALRDRILSLAAQAGIERSRVFEVDASRRTRAINAYVTGVGGSARIVLWDTLLQRLDEDEVAYVMAHEMGHYVERHVPILLFASIFGTLGVLFIADRSARLLITRRGSDWSVRSMDDMASLPVYLLLVLAVNFFGSPVQSAISRTLERRADAFGLRLTRDGEAAASAFVKLSELNLANPEPPPFIEWWMFSHPPLNQRIRAALQSGTKE